jgi:hypothetical protein
MILHLSKMTEVMKSNLVQLVTSPTLAIARFQRRTFSWVIRPLEMILAEMILALEVTVKTVRAAHPTLKPTSTRLAPMTSDLSTLVGPQTSAL